MTPPASGVDSIHLLHLGALHTQRRFTMQDGGDAPITLPVPAFLITAGDRLILVDTGMSPEGVADPEGTWGRLAKVYAPEVSDEDTLPARLAALGLGPGDITDVVLTHLHYDHAGGVLLFPGAKRWVQRAEYRHALHPSRHYAGGYFPGEFGEGFELLDGDTTLAPGIHLLFTPGHTQGHQSVLVQVGDSWYCLTGDVVDDGEILERRRMPAVVVDVDAQLQSMARLRLLRSALDAQLIFSHDAQLHASLAPFPAPIASRENRA